jgi:hypothetical protein
VLLDYDYWQDGWRRMSYPRVRRDRRIPRDQQVRQHFALLASSLHLGPWSNVQIILLVCSCYCFMCDVCTSASSVDKVPVVVHKRCERTNHQGTSKWPFCELPNAAAVVRRSRRWYCGVAGSSNGNHNIGGLICRCVILLCLLSAIQFIYVKSSLLVGTKDKYNGKTAAARAPNRKQDIKAMKKTNAEMKALFRENQTIGLEDLADIASVNLPPTTWEEALIDRGPILDVLHRFGLNVTLPVLQRLPTWSQVVRLYGDRPVVWEPNEIDVHGNHVQGNGSSTTTTCAAFRQRVAVQHRYVGVAGQMNTGTNALSKYLTQNIFLAGQWDTKTRGVLWTVPWYKHGWADLRFRFRYRETPQDHSNVLAVVLIRDPYFWMQRYESCAVLRCSECPHYRSQMAL